MYLLSFQENKANLSRSNSDKDNSREQEAAVKMRGEGRAERNAFLTNKRFSAFMTLVS